MSDADIEDLEDHWNDISCKDVVAAICKIYPSCKGDYRLLDYRYLRYMGVNITLRDFDQLRRIWSIGTVNRRYRELQDENPNEYAPTEATLLKRAKNERVIRKYYRPEVKAQPMAMYL